MVIGLVFCIRHNVVWCVGHQRTIAHELTDGWILWFTVLDDCLQHIHAYGDCLQSSMSCPVRVIDIERLIWVVIISAESRSSATKREHFSIQVSRVECVRVIARSLTFFWRRMSLWVWIFRLCRQSTGMCSSLTRLTGWRITSLLWVHECLLFWQFLCGICW